MMRLPYFRFESPRTVGEAAELMAKAAPGEAMLVAGGTDLLPNMKRRQQVPRTLGGNLCLDTRCNYYDQNYEWRKAIDFCMKKDDRAVERGAQQICWVATSSPRCLAVSSTDTAPALIALGAQVTLVS